MEARIIGWSHLPFRSRDNASLEELIAAVARQALLHAEVGPEEIDEIFVGHFGSGFSEQGFAASLALQTDHRLRFKAATRVENACATGSAAIHCALRAIEAGRARAALVIGCEKMSSARPEDVSRNLLRAAYLPEDGSESFGFAGIFAKVALAYSEAYGDCSNALAAIAAKNYRNGVDNPYAQIQKDYGVEFCSQVGDRNPIVAPPLKRSDCAPVSDGAAAFVLSSCDLERDAPRALRFRAAVHVNDFLPRSRRDVLLFEGCSVAWKQALDKASIDLADLSFVETHDCFTIAELLEYEAMGLCGKGRGGEAVMAGITQKTGKLPINPSGGLKAKGHPIGATGVSMHVLAAMQLTQEAGGMQIPGARLGGVFNMGGLAVANYVSILERTK